ncbi:MAG: hypothetical protein ABWW70_00820 [Thermoproteota archaeon]
MSRNSLFLLGMVIVALVVLARAPYTLKMVHQTSPSPENHYYTGSFEFVRLAAARYPVQLGGVELLEKILGNPHRTAIYVVIGPELPFTPAEVSKIRRYVEEGRLSILVADETGTANTLTEPLLKVRIAGHIVLNASGTYIVPYRCMGSTILSSKVSYLASFPREAKVLCTVEAAHAELPAAVLLKLPSGSSALVIADSSIFANFLISGWPGMGSSRSIALLLLAQLEPYRADVVVFDNEHYRATRTEELGKIAEQAMFIIGRAGEALGGWLASLNPLAVAATLSLAGLVLASLAVGAPPRHVPERSKFEEITRMYERRVKHEDTGGFG